MRLYKLGTPSYEDTDTSLNKYQVNTKNVENNSQLP